MSSGNSFGIGVASVVAKQEHRFDKAPAGTAMVYLASYAADPLAEALDPVIAALRSADGLGEVARWFGRRVEDGGFSWDAVYLRGPEEPYAQIPDITSVFVLEHGNAVPKVPHLPATQYAFVDRQSAEAHAAWMASRFSWDGIQVRCMLAARAWDTLIRDA